MPKAQGTFVLLGVGVSFLHCLNHFGMDIIVVKAKYVLIN